MNILTDEEIDIIVQNHRGNSYDNLARAIESAVLKRLAEQNVEPVAYTCNHAFYRLKPCSSINGHPFIPLYTETQLLAAQQRTAKACAKAVFEQAKYFGYNVHAEAVRDAALNNWREYL